MTRTSDGIQCGSKCFIARKEDFQKAITEAGSLPVIAVYADGHADFTTLIGYIVEVTLLGGNRWNVKTDGMRTKGATVIVH